MVDACSATCQTAFQVADLYLVVPLAALGREGVRIFEPLDLEQL
jgi:hypothetical protein